MSIKQVSVYFCDFCGKEITDKEHMIITKGDNDYYSRIECDGESVNIEEQHFDNIKCFTSWLIRELDIHIDYAY